MRRGAGPGRTRDDHLDLAAQALSLLARARDVAELADLLGADALSETERAYLAFGDAFDSELQQRPDEERPLDDTLDRVWRAVAVLPRRELTMLAPDELDRRFRRADDEKEAPGGRPTTSG